MVEIIIDGKKIKAEAGSSLLEAAIRAGKSIPHFCYHKKLSVTASCRMCLVEVEKALRLLPACATPVVDGMVVHTDTEKVAAARRAVMEFLLINHPLDCPICDRGGECRLQDYAFLYGANTSRYQEEKRIVFAKQVSPLISMQEMNRCIQCTRCVRFSEEIGGQEEFGVVNRGGHAEITTFFGKQLNSELSGNMIDICPVGALTSKLFRYAARSWELVSHFSVSPHDGLGTNLTVQTCQDKVMRVLPYENEAINECWLSDRDRFSYEALNSNQERLTVPMVKQGGRWIETDWQTALSYVAHGLKCIRDEHGPLALAALHAPQATLEESFLLQKLLRGLGSEKIEFRLRQSDFSLDGKIMPWLGMPVQQIDKLDYALIIGSFLRQDVPLLAARFRKAAKHGTRIGMLHAAEDDWLMPAADCLILSPDKWLTVLGEMICAIAERKKLPIPDGFQRLPISAMAAQFAISLMASGKKAVFMGRLVLQHPKMALLHKAVEWIAVATGAAFGYLTEGANSTGALLANAFPTPGSGISLDTIASESTKAFLLLHTEPEFDAADQPAMVAALKQAEMVVVMAPFKQSLDYADVLLPVSPFSETAGTFVSFEGRMQSFNAAVLPLGQTRPAWKVLRVLGNFLDLQGFEYDSLADVRKDCLQDRQIASVLTNFSGEAPQFAACPESGMVRIADVPLYFSDSIVRRAQALQQTPAAESPAVHLPGKLFDELGIAKGDAVCVIQAGGQQILRAYRDAGLPQDVVRLAAGHKATAKLGPVSGRIRVERI